jgi:hypothetical protein
VALDGAKRGWAAADHATRARPARRPTPLAASHGNLPKRRRRRARDARLKRFQPARRVPFTRFRGSQRPAPSRRQGRNRAVVKIFDATGSIARAMPGARVRELPFSPREDVARSAGRGDRALAGAGGSSSPAPLPSGRGETRATSSGTSIPGVRRETRRFSSGCKPHPANAPAGSNRSSHGGNEVAEAFGVAGHV